MKCLIVKEGASWHSSRITSDKRNKREKNANVLTRTRKTTSTNVRHCFFAAVLVFFSLAYYGHVNHDKKLSPLHKLTSLLMYYMGKNRQTQFF